MQMDPLHTACMHACMNDNVNLGTLTVLGIYTNGPNLNPYN